MYCPVIPSCWVYCTLQPPVLSRLRQLHAAVQAYRTEQAAEAAERARAASAGVITKTAKAAVSLVGSVASSMLPGFVVSSAPAGPPESYQLLRDAGVPIDEEHEAGADSGNTAATTAAAHAALDAVSSTFPGAHHTRGSTHGSTDPPQSPDYNDSGTQASVHAVQRPGVLQYSAQQQQQHRLAPAGPSAAASSTTEITNASGASDGADSASPAGGAPHVVLGGSSGSMMSSGNSNLSALQVVTELSVNIDAEEGAEILKDMSELALLESLFVDSTDEFKFDPGEAAWDCL